MSEIRDELDPPFEIIEPAACRGPVLFNSPHSGSIYPREFLTVSRLDIATLRRSEDSFVDALIAGVVRRRLPADAGAFPALLCGREPRALRARSAHVRGPPALLRQYPLDAGRRRARHRGARGRRRAGNLRPAHPGRRRARAASRACTSPITGRCGACSPALHRDFGAAVLVDCHSMPSTAGQKDERPRPEFVLGDRYGTSCVGVVAETVEATLRGLGYSVSRNKPYAGGFITEHYGNPAAGLHAIQLEINRALYMDERRYQRSDELRAPGGRLRHAGAAAGRDPAGGAAALSGGGRIAAQAVSPILIAKKRAARGCKRPKSREETPKEGNGSSRYRIAIIYTATHKNQDFQAPNYMQICMAADRLSRRKSSICPRLWPRCHKLSARGQRIRANGHAVPP